MGKIHEKDTSNADETHIFINVDNDKTFGFYGTEELKMQTLLAVVKDLKWLYTVLEGGMLASSPHS